MGSLKFWRWVSAGTLATLCCLGTSYSAEPENGAKAIVKIDKAAPLKKFPSEKYAVPGKAVPEAGSNMAYGGSLRTGIFAGGPGFIRLKDWPDDEEVVLVSGHLVIVSDDGKTSSFGPGDVFIIPKGFNGTYEMKDKMKEIYIEPGK
jgi:uncharacterized cupin superfamily protein